MTGPSPRPTRERAKLTAIHNLLPRLRPYLPDDLFGELSAWLYVLPKQPLTEADVRRGQEIAIELADEVSS